MSVHGGGAGACVCSRSELAGETGVRRGRPMAPRTSRLIFGVRDLVSFVQGIGILSDPVVEASGD